MRKLSFILVVGSLLSSAIGQQPPAEIQWAKYPANQHWYGIPFSPTTWYQGEALALSQGGHLATIRSSDENAWIQSTFSGFNANCYWIGLNDDLIEGTFVWTSGEPVTYTNWALGQPNNSGDAVQVVPPNTWRWDDTDANAACTPIAEIALIPQTGFTIPISYSTQSQPAYHAIGDVTGDLMPDLVVPNRGSASLSIFPGGVAGSFGSPTTVSTPMGPFTVVVGRLDSDADLDIAVACYEGQSVRVLWNDGSGAFPTSVDHAFVGRAHGLALADFDADGDNDLAATTIDTQDRMLVLKNNGDGTFAAPVHYPTGAHPLYVTARDLDGDADVDLVVANFDSDDLGIYRNQGNGTFVTSSLLARGNGPGLVAVGDFDLNGMVDLAIPNRFDDMIRFWWGTSSGVFVAGPQYSAGVEPSACITADLDGDHRDDLVTACLGTDNAWIYYARAGAPDPTPTVLFVGDGPAGIAAADLNANGRDDLSFTAFVSNRVVNLFKISRDCNDNDIDDPRDIELGISDDCNANWIPDECDLAPDQPFDCDDNGMIDSCEIAADPSLDLSSHGVGDGILDMCQSAGETYCYGDATGIACPCDPGQAGNPGTGCKNSAGRSGRLIGVGNPEVGYDSVSLRATGLLPAAIGLFFQGNSAHGPLGMGAILGDGILCANVSVKRLGIRSATDGAMAYGYPVDSPISVVGMVPLGATRYYQVWYRDPDTSFCTPSTFNLSNGFRIVWQ